MTDDPAPPGAPELQTTLVNAGFSRGRGKRVEWKNVQLISVPLPMSQLGTKAFGDLVRRHSPGKGWTLEGYCIP